MGDLHLRPVTWERLWTKAVAARCIAVSNTWKNVRIKPNKAKRRHAHCQSPVTVNATVNTTVAVHPLYAVRRKML